MEIYKLMKGFWSNLSPDNFMRSRTAPGWVLLEFASAASQILSTTIMRVTKIDILGKQ